MTTNYKKINSIVLNFLIGCSLCAQNGPGGIGSKDGTSILTHWLDASAVKGANITTWPDKSGYNHSARGTGAQLKTNEINGQPAVKFDGSSRTYYVDGTVSNPYTIFSVAKQDGGNRNRLISSAANNWLFGYWSGLEDVWYAEGWVNYPGQGASGEPAIYTGTSDGSISSFYKNGNLIVSNSNGVTAPSGLRLGGWLEYNELSDGKISELIVFSTVLNPVQRILVENYLNAKYDLPIANDKYTQPSATAYINGVSGIGMEGADKNTVSNSGGLIISDHSFLQDSSDYILTGYHLDDNSVATYTDLPAGVVRRFARDWYIDITDASSNGGFIDLGFSMKESGYLGMPAGNTYQLLYRALPSGDYTVINASPTIAGDSITFSNIDVATLSKGYYTLGLPAASPMSITGITTIQASLDTINAGTLNNPIITVEITSTGDSLAIMLNAINLTNTGTTKNSDISMYHLYAGNSPNFSSATELVSASNIDSLTFATMPLLYGNSYFFLTADIQPLATVNDTVDAQCMLVTLSNGPQVPYITSPSGYRVIKPVLYCHPYTNGNCCATGISNFTCNNINNSSSPDNQYSDYRNLAVETYKNEPVNFSITTRDYMISTIWVDWNKDGVFNSSDEQVFHSGVYNYNLRGSFTIPVSVVEGDSLRMRVGTGYASQPMTDPCFQIEHTEWEDYTLKIKKSVNMSYVANYITQSDTSDVIRGDVNKIMLRVVVETNGNFNPLNITDFAFNTLGSSNSSKDVSNYKLVQGDKDSTFANAVVIAQANSLTGLSYAPVRLYSGKNYFWLTYDISDAAAFDDHLDAGIDTIRMDGGAGDVAASTPNPLGRRTVVPCHPTVVANCCNYGISSVSFNYGAEHTSGYDGYTDYSHTIGANTYAKDSVHFSIKHNNDQFIVIWVDWNKNRDFENSEQVYADYNDRTGVFSGNIYVPDSLTSPDTLKMRIVTGNTPPSACVSQYGEFEDYALFINVPEKMIYDSSSAFQEAINTIGTNVKKGSEDNVVLGVNLYTHGNLSPVKVDALVLNNIGTTAISDITLYRLYFGGLSPVFANARLIATETVIDTLRFDTLQMGTGKNYFWLTADVDTSARIGNHLDFECTSISIDSMWETPSIQVPSNYYVVTDEQYPFGSNAWIAYAFDGYNFDTYRGYYSVGGLNFNSMDSWDNGGTPSSAPGYKGATVGSDNHSVQYRRKGFPKGRYQLDVPGHDDGLTVYLNGVSIFEHSGCCDSHSNIWTGVLDETSKITYAWQEGGGASYGLLSFNMLCDATTSDTTATACDTFTWYSNTYTTSGNPTRIIPNTSNCDSIITLHLTINHSTTSDTTATACNSFTWYGNAYTASGNQTHVIKNTVGCDSTITLHLTINNSTTSDTTAIACNSFTWYGNTYTASGNQTHVVKNAAGCDSTITLHLTINHSTSGDTTAIACNSFTWYGNVYTSSGNQTRVIKNAAGCDSTITLHLTINQSTSSDTTAIACNNFTWYGNTYTASGNQTHVIKNAADCDSTITLHLTINYSTTSDTTATACNSFTWYGNTYTASGNQTHVIKNAASCDSTITLHLTINHSTISDTPATACNSFTWYGNTYTASGNQTHVIKNAA
ncbi:MAG TPA: BNR-repeat neuraminidase N-terminal domain-containing protein, partial [Bacteroidia bacterium]|nr:BNR-repeat neuraminidase N-terminal domain-containing protein [Bacteroidia bacterium]